MHHTTLGRTGLKVSVAGLGTGGFSRLGLKTGLTEDQSAGMIHEAYDLGVNFIDTAPSYGTEGVVGKALKTLPRDKVVVATKAQIGRDGNFLPAERVVASLDKSLAAMGTDYVDVFNLHGIEPPEYEHAINVIAPALVEEKRKGKIRHIGITENPITDHTNAMFDQAKRDDVWEVLMVGFSMLHQGARTRVFPTTRARGIGTLLMFAVRSIFADPPRVARELRELAAKGLVEKSLGDTDDPLGFLRARRRRGEHDRGGVSLCAARARRRRRAVRYRQRRAYAREHRRDQQAAIAGGRPREAQDAVRPPGERHRPRRPRRQDAVSRDLPSRIRQLSPRHPEERRRGGASKDDGPAAAHRGRASFEGRLTARTSG